MSRLSRIFGRRRGRASREAEVVTALRELEETLEQVEAKLKAEASRARRAPPKPTPRRVEESAYEPEPVPEQPPPELPPAIHGPLFAESVELDVGPFADFGALSAFERELARVPDVTGIDVRRFLGDRALVELTATRELPLLDLLRATLSHGFEIEQVEREYLKITLSSE
jgi:hypothetical protein